jgi:hypothetical protein
MLKTTLLFYSDGAVIALFKYTAPWFIFNLAEIKRLSGAGMPSLAYGIAANKPFCNALV